MLPVLLMFVINVAQTAPVFPMNIINNVEQTGVPGPMGRTLRMLTLMSTVVVSEGDASKKKEKKKRIFSTVLREGASLSGTLCSSCFSYVPG